MIKINKRHLAKAFSWRFIGTVDTFIFAWIISGDLSEGINVSLITTLTKLIWYYIHEQLWFKVKRISASKRHIYKTFSWRAVGTLDTIIFSWIIIGNPLVGLKIGGAEVVSKMILYYLHEKLWYKINFGLNSRFKIKNKNKK